MHTHAHTHARTQLMGVSQDPYSFFMDLLRGALALQLGSAAALFYGAELGAGLDSGAALRCVAGLGLGYMLRLGIKIEQLVSSSSRRHGCACACARCICLDSARGSTHTHAHMCMHA